MAIPPKESRIGVNVSQLNRIMSAYIEQHTDITNNFQIQLTGTQFPRLLKYFTFENFEPNQISLLNVKQVNNNYMTLLSQIIKEGASAKNMYISGVEVVRDLPSDKSQGVAEQLIFETDQELFETIQILSKTKKIVFRSCQFKNRFNTSIDFIKDLECETIEFEDCQITTDIAFKIISHLIMSSNLITSLKVLNFLDLADKPRDETRHEEFQKLLGSIIYNFLPFEWDLTKTTPPMLFIEENKVARTESDGY